MPRILSRAVFRFLAVLALLSAGTQYAIAGQPLRIGFMPGPYRDAFAQGVAPQLEKKGYTIRYVEFSQGVQPDDAVEHGAIDANIFQHTLYLNAINRQENFHLVGIVHVPTPPMGLYSKRYKRLADIPDGATVTIPSDPVNAARALNILAGLGWVKLKPGIDPIKVSELDVVENPRKLRIIPLDSAQAPRSLEDADLAAIQGNYAVSSGLSLTSALKLENMTLPYVNVVAVRKDKAHAKFANDIVAAYESAQFQKIFRANPVWAGYRLPDYFTK